MRCFAKPSPSASERVGFAAWLAQWLCALLLAASTALLHAQTNSAEPLGIVMTGIQGTAVRLTPNTNNPAAPSWDLQADFNVALPARLADLARSTPIYFVLEWRMSRPRWYWRDQKLTQGELHWRLSHNPLTQQWRISSDTTATLRNGRFAISYDSLNEALASLRRIRRDGLVQAAELQANQKYELTVRLRLDTAQLPKPFQINAITNNDWALDSGLLEHVFVAAAPVSVMTPVAPK